MTTLLTILVYYKYGYGLSTVAYLLLIYAIVVASFTDLDHMIIPDSVNLFIGITGVISIFAGLTVHWKQGLLGFLAGGGVLLLLGYLSLWLLKKEGMGGGDIKLAAVCGLFLGMGKTILSLVLSSYIALFVIFILITLKKFKRGQYIPYGPFISAGVLVVILFYDEIISLYHKIFL
jgi:leader peptidase (prepilin peptidase)/N-methyltransferase